MPYRDLIRLGNKLVITFAVNLKDRGTFGVKVLGVDRYGP